MRHVVLITGGVMLAIALIIVSFTFFQASREELGLSADLQYRTRVLTDSLKVSVSPSVLSHSTSTVQSIVDRIANNDRVIGLGVYNSDGTPIAVSNQLPDDISTNPIVTTAMDTDTPSGIFIPAQEGRVYIFVNPLHSDNRVIGALVVAQNAAYIDTTIWNIWQDNLVRLFLQLIVIGAALFALVRWVIFKPLSILTESVRAARRGETDTAPTGSHSFLMPLSSEISKISTNLKQARFAAREEARMRLEKLDSPWTAERLKEFMSAYFKNRPIFVVSYREPYVHSKGKNNTVTVSVPAGGVITALESVMEACGGTWIAYGSGNADKKVVDGDDKIMVPPEEPKYTLKRVWLTEKEVAGHYSGFSNEALWPLCHMAHVRPLFRAEDWREYRKVNGLFAKTLLNEIRHVERPLVLIQDYQLALVPAMIKKSRPDAQVAIFWHIPWPSAAQFSICPWRKDILEGLLGADLVGFHTQQYCNDFMETVGNEIESRIDFDHFSVTRADHETHVKPFPISVAFSGAAASRPEPDRSALEALGIRTDFIGLGVERLDYTKGILERFKGLEFFFLQHPEYRERFTFLQIASPSRESIAKYREYGEQVRAEAERINKEIGMRDWKPIVLENRNYSREELDPLFRIANLCLVTPVHDGMNLVAKEYVAARDEEDGALILSQFTGASRGLKGAILINPYSAENTAEAIHKALTMTPADQHRRMKSMRNSVRDYNVYRWSAELIKTLAQQD
ncbi:trehalose-6-phosphate synthase [Candidatus Kaiserbacteria bacterium]|nr:trehalose-6-phosphate synthase [Candidatus Kaiserbacteria bacterium]